MKGYFRRAFFAIAATVSALSGGALMSACTDVDDTLGLGMVPEDQKMKVVVTTLDGVKTFYAFTDSLPTENLRRMVLGSMDTDFGLTTTSGIYQFMPLESFEYRGDPYFGKDAVADSAFLALYINYITGNTNVPQTFYVYPLLDTMRYDTSYYANYDPFASGKVNKADSIFKFTLHDEITGITFKKLQSINTRGTDFLKKIVDLPKEVWEDENNNKGLFHKNIPGFFIAPADDNEKNAAIYEILMADSHYQEDLSYFTIFSHFTQSTTPQTVLDTLETRFYFDDQQTSSPLMSNLSVAIIGHDYTNTPIEASLQHYGDTLATSVNREQTYVQSMVGPSSMLYFDAAFKAKLKDLYDNMDEQYKSIYINRARLLIPMSPGIDSPNYYLAADAAPKRTGLFLKYTGTLPVSIPDYPYLDEALNGTTSTFGGYLNRSKGYYEMDISIYLRQLIVNPDGTRDRIWLSPAYSTNTFSRLEEVVIENSGQNPIEIELTYTLIK